MSASTCLRDLGDGLILRRSTAADAEALAEFNSKIHSDAGPETPDLWVGAWTHDLLARPHPTCKEDDFTVVEDTVNRRIVSSMNLIPQTWSYGGVEFGVGRPELVGTLPEYRNRGLVRLQFDVIHQWSAERDHLMQGITGIPYYYRLFGYEMALDLGGGRAGFTPHIPKLKESESEPFNIRPAAEADLPFIADLYDQGRRRSLLSCVWNDALWRYELTGKDAKNVNRADLRVIETPTGERVGFLAHPPFVWGAMMVTTVYELKAGVSWAAVTPSVIRYLQATGEVYQPPLGNKEPFGSFGFWFSVDHPVYHVIPDKLPRVRQPYAWYIRVPDLPAFLRHVAPVLEQRMAASPLAGHTGDVKLSFYRTGIRLAFENGRLTSVEAYLPTPVGHSGDAAFPGLTFLQLLCGYRSLDELKYAFVDCWTSNDTIYALLTTLFPKQPSVVWPVS
jgi:hypothetical protein